MAKPLNILYTQQLKDSPVVTDLVAKGHNVMPLVIDGADLILGPTCCRFMPGMEFALDSIIKGARKIKYPTKEGKDAK